MEFGFRHPASTDDRLVKTHAICVPEGGRLHRVEVILQLKCCYFLFVKICFLQLAKQISGS